MSNSKKYVGNKITKVKLKPTNWFDPDTQNLKLHLQLKPQENVMQLGMDVIRVTKVQEDPSAINVCESTSRPVKVFKHEKLSLRGRKVAQPYKTTLPVKTVVHASELTPAGEATVPQRRNVKHEKFKTPSNIGVKLTETFKIKEETTRRASRRKPDSIYISKKVSPCRNSNVTSQQIYKRNSKGTFSRTSTQIVKSESTTGERIHVRKTSLTVTLDPRAVSKLQGERYSQSPLAASGERRRSPSASKFTSISHRKIIRISETAEIKASPILPTKRVKLSTDLSEKLQMTVSSPQASDNKRNIDVNDKERRSTAVPVKRKKSSFSFERPRKKLFAHSPSPQRRDYSKTVRKSFEARTPDTEDELKLTQRKRTIVDSRSTKARNAATKVIHSVNEAFIDNENYSPAIEKSFTDTSSPEVVKHKHDIPKVRKSVMADDISHESVTATVSPGTRVPVKPKVATGITKESLSPLLTSEERVLPQCSSSPTETLADMMCEVLRGEESFPQFEQFQQFSPELGSSEFRCISYAIPVTEFGFTDETTIRPNRVQQSDTVHSKATTPLLNKTSDNKFSTEELQTPKKSDIKKLVSETSVTKPYLEDEVYQHKLIKDENLLVEERLKAISTPSPKEYKRRSISKNAVTDLSANAITFDEKISRLIAEDKTTALDSEKTVMQQSNAVKADDRLGDSQGPSDTSSEAKTENVMSLSRPETIGDINSVKVISLEDMDKLKADRQDDFSCQSLKDDSASAINVQAVLEHKKDDYIDKISVKHTDIENYAVLDAEQNKIDRANVIPCDAKIDTETAAEEGKISSLDVCPTKYDSAVIKMASPVHAGLEKDPRQHAGISHEPEASEKSHRPSVIEDKKLQGDIDPTLDTAIIKSPHTSVVAENIASEHGIASSLGIAPAKSPLTSAMESTASKHGIAPTLDTTEIVKSPHTSATEATDLTQTVEPITLTVATPVKSTKSAIEDTALEHDIGPVLDKIEPPVSYTSATENTDLDQIIEPVLDKIVSPIKSTHESATEDTDLKQTVEPIPDTISTPIKSTHMPASETTVESILGTSSSTLNAELSALEHDVSPALETVATPIKSPLTSVTQSTDLDKSIEPVLDSLVSTIHSPASEDLQLKKIESDTSKLNLAFSPTKVVVPGSPIQAALPSTILDQDLNFVKISRSPAPETSVAIDEKAGIDSKEHDVDEPQSSASLTESLTLLESLDETVESVQVARPSSDISIASSSLKVPSFTSSPHDTLAQISALEDVSVHEDTVEKLPLSPKFAGVSDVQAEEDTTLKSQTSSDDVKLDQPSKTSISLTNELINLEFPSFDSMIPTSEIPVVDTGSCLRDTIIIPESYETSIGEEVSETDVILPRTPMRTIENDEPLKQDEGQEFQNQLIEEDTLQTEVTTSVTAMAAERVIPALEHDATPTPSVRRSVWSKLVFPCVWYFCQTFLALALLVYFYFKACVVYQKQVIIWSVAMLQVAWQIVVAQEKGNNNVKELLMLDVAWVCIGLYIKALVSMNGFFFAPMCYTYSYLFG